MLIWDETNLLTSGAGPNKNIYFPAMIIDQN